MDDSSKQPHLFGNGAQRSPHPRPFFYVQPPSQPYYLYQQHWQLNNPYGHFGLPAGFNFGRPCIPPYPYAPYPGFVLPHAPLYPVDYRRMFEPRFHASPWGDVPRQQHHYPQPHGRRETACSGAQTDPSDAITKLIECLDKIRATELQSADRELDSGVGSQSSGMFFPREEKKIEEQGHALSSGPHEGSLESPAVALSESTQVILDPQNLQQCWAERLERELPLDSSSVQEDSPERSASNEHSVSLEKEEVMDIQTSISMTNSSISMTNSSVPRQDAEEYLKSTSSPTFLSSQLPHNEAISSEEVSKPEDLGAYCGDSNADEGYQILKLPFGSVLTPGAGHLSSPATPYYCNYLPMQTTHERMSVLSPSLDELSSRDEMFSTDLDDVDLFPNSVYANRRITEVVTGSPRTVEDNMWFPHSKRSSCACCGRSLAKGVSRSKLHSSKMYRDEGGDSEEEDQYGRGCEQPVRVVVRKHSAPRKNQSVPPRHAAKPWYKRGHYKELSEPLKQEEDVCNVQAPEAETELDSNEQQCRTCQDRLCREDVTTDQGRWADGDVIPRRKQAPPLQRQGMEAATSTFQHSYGLGPRGSNLKHGAEPSQRPHEGSSGPPRPEEQYHKPFFYIQPPQPYLPMQSLQWPVPMAMPVSYNPYYGYPGLGYGLPMMPHYQPTPYVEPPGFVVPHTHLHLMDYRRMLNPQYYQTMAYHARRFRYQHNSSTKEMTSSEVQTEPLVPAQRTSPPSSSECPTHTPSIPTGALLPPVSGVQNKDLFMELQEKVPSSTTRTPSKGSFVIQTEELRIECCTTPAGLQLLQAHETAEMSHSFPQDMVQCSSLVQSHVLQDEGLHLPADQSEQELQVCPDILLVGKPSTVEMNPLEEPRNLTDSVTVTSSLDFLETTCAKAEEMRSESDLGISPNNFHLKGVHLPFDPKYLDELRKMESTVWSAEETFSSPELLIQNCFTKSDKNILMASAEVMEPEMLIEEVPSKEIIHVIEMFPLVEEDLEEVVSTMESVENEMESEADSSPAAEEAPIAELTNTTEVVLLNSFPSEADGDQQKLERNEDHPDTSFESLPAYLPSASWLSDFDHTYYSTAKMPPAPKKQNRPLSSHGSDVPKRRRKLDMDYKEQPSIRKPKERYKPKGKVDRQSFSDHECCVSRKFNENLLSPCVSKKERLCSRCLAKGGDCTSPSSGCDGQSLKRKAVPFQQWNDALLPTCEACKSHSKRPLMRKGSNPDLCGHRHNTEGESSGNSSCRTSPQWRPANDSVNINRLLASKRPAVIYPKLREKNCVCNDLQHQSATWERQHHCPHGNAIREMDENCAVPVSFENKWNVGQTYPTHRWRTEKSWRDMMPNTGNDGFRNEATTQHTFNHKKTQSQGIRTRDTRC